MLFVHICLHLCLHHPFQGLNEKNELSSEVGIIGHRVTYSNGVEAHEQMTRPPLSSVKLPVPESVRALKIGKG